jgi:hypothetical protein
VTGSTVGLCVPNIPRSMRSAPPGRSGAREVPARGADGPDDIQRGCDLFGGDAGGAAIP